MSEQIDAETLTERIDLSRECAGIAIGSAMAMATTDNPLRVLQQAIAIWPDEVSDHALVIGQRVALALLYQLDLDATAMAQVAVSLTTPETDDESRGADDNGQ